MHNTKLFCHLRFRHQTARTRFDADQVARFGQHPAQHGRRRNKSRRDFFFKQKKSQDGHVRNFCQKHPDSADLPVYFAQRADFRSGCLGDSYHGFLSGSCRCCFIFIAEQFWCGSSDKLPLSFNALHDFHAAVDYFGRPKPWLWRLNSEKLALFVIFGYNG